MLKNILMGILGAVIVVAIAVSAYGLCFPSANTQSTSALGTGTAAAMEMVRAKTAQTHRCWTSPCPI